MKRTITLILSSSCLFLTSINAVTVIDRNGHVYQTQPPQPQPKHQPTRKEYYDSFGRSLGHSEKYSFSNRTDHYDSYGRLEGYSERSAFGEISHYDQYGRYQGSTRER